MLKELLSDLRKGKRRRVNYDGTKLLFLPDSRDKLNKGDFVVTKAGIGLDDEVCCRNYLTRYRVDGDWMGRGKILAKVVYPKGNQMGFVDLDFLAKKNVFIHVIPDVLDFTGKPQARLVICGGGKRVELPLPYERIKLEHTLSLLKTCLNDPSQIILGWNLKGLFSFVRHFTKRDLVFESKVIDLKLMELFAGNPDAKCPAGYQEAFQRVVAITSSPHWPKISRYYQEVAFPLLSRVIPNIENTPLVHVELKRNLHPNYEIEGQVNGRLRCSTTFASGYNPHSMAEVLKTKLNPPGYDLEFLYLDFKHMEVSVLYWLSQDPVLGRIIASGQDLYAGIWEELTSLACTESYREKCKDLFLPVVYGQGVASVAERLKIPEKTASKLVDRIYRIFSVALDYVRNVQSSLDEQDSVMDPFGRRRQFIEQQYRVRNFIIQSTASTICLHKLVKLYDVAHKDGSKIAFHVHDGYGLLVSKKDMSRLAKKYASVLEAEEVYYPGLKLKVAYQAGTRLDRLRKL